MTATLFVKSGDEFIRASTGVKKDDGSRAIGTTLGIAIAQVKPTRSGGHFGQVYITGHEPMKDGSGNIIGAYYVGYPQ
jgi:Cache 3/Cache 2 fusion domain